MWLSLSIFGEYVGIVDGAADRLWQDPSIDPKDAMWLAPSLHLAQFHTAGISASMAMLSKALQLAEQQGDYACQLACLWGLFGARLTEARYSDSLEFALRFADLAPRVADPVQRAVGHRVVGLCTWRNGDLAGARRYSDIALAPVEPNPDSPVNQSLIYKQGVAARASASNLLWLTGFADQAVVQAADAVAMGLEHDVLGLCYSLAQAIVPLAFWIGDLDQARAHTMLLIDLASDNGLRFWLHWGRSYECALQRLSSKLRRGADFHRYQRRVAGGAAPAHTCDHPRRRARTGGGRRTPANALVRSRAIAGRGAWFVEGGKNARRPGPAQRSAEYFQAPRRVCVGAQGGNHAGGIVPCGRAITGGPGSACAGGKASDRRF
jgi:hypothetical protein